jgi:PIN domain nuclease of toxin-antitoxin system
MSLLDDPNHVLDFDACAKISEMHDRMIVGAARRMNAKLITRDKQIIKSRLVTTVW